MSAKTWLMLAHLGVGLLPGPTGTYASILAVAAFVLAHLTWPPLAWLLLAAATLLGFSAADRAEKVFGPDAREIVIDEVAGQCLALALVPLTPGNVLTAFLLFRLLDVFKPWPISLTERLPGGLGVMADDLLAGFLAGAFLQLIALLWR